MKRSDMIQLLDSKFIFPEGLASDILEVLEEAGMKPPEIDVYIEKHLCTENKWELENEAK